MSATDYMRCPFCNGVPESMNEDLLRVIAQMDLISSKQFAIEYYNANKRVEENECDSIAYYEEYWIDNDGILKLRVGAHCHNCGLDWDGKLDMKGK